MSIDPFDVQVGTAEKICKKFCDEKSRQSAPTQRRVDNDRIELQSMYRGVSNRRVNNRANYSAEFATALQSEHQGLAGP